MDNSAFQYEKVEIISAWILWQDKSRRMHHLVLGPRYRSIRQFLLARSVESERQEHRSGRSLQGHVLGTSEEMPAVLMCGQEGVLEMP